MCVGSFCRLCHLLSEEYKIGGGSMTETAEEFLDGVRNCIDFLFIL